MKKALTICLSIFLFASCSGMLDIMCFDRTVRIRTSGTGNSVTKSSSDIRTRSYEIGDGLMLEETVSDCWDDTGSQTKGSIITSNGYNKINESGRSFRIEGWLGSDIATAHDSSPEDISDRHFLSDVSTFNGTGWNLASEHFWRNGISSTFWSYYVPAGCPEPVFTWPGSMPSDDQLRTLSFTYTLPDPSATPNDALRTNDLLVAYNSETRTINEDGSVSMTYGTGTASKKNSISISFRHPLSAVKFKIGSISGDPLTTDNEYVDITKVELIGVKTTGVFSATGNGADECSIICNSSSGSATYAQEASRSEIENGKFTSADSDYVFFMIPQNVDDVTVRLTMTRRKKTITYESDGTTVHSISYGDLTTFTREVTLSGDWLPGKYYTYKISSVVYFGGETVTLDPDKLEISSDNIIVDGNNLQFSVSGSVDFKEWVAPLPAKGVKILKLTITHTYTNKSGKSWRNIWLENASVNPDYTEGSTAPHFINPEGISTKTPELVTEALTLPNKNTLWKDGHYTGILGETILGSGGKYNATAYDNNMNQSSGGTYTSIMYFYLGGKFDYVKIHFDYGGDTGGGSIGWTAEIPVFNITEVIE